MAEERDNTSREDLTDEASPYRRDEFRKQGRVAQSRELTGMIALTASGVALYMSLPGFSDQYVTFMKSLFRVDVASRLNFLSDGVIANVLHNMLSLIGSITVPVILTGFVLGILGSYAQVGTIFSLEPLTPDVEKINPLAGIRRYFTLRFVYESLRLIIRAAAVIAVGYYFISQDVKTAASYSIQEPVTVLNAFGGSWKVLFASLCSLLLVFSGFDFWIQKFEYNKSLRLTRQEQKQEHKEHEGDPLIKARIRSIQREVARRRMMTAVKKADVVITNPTHIAVAIIYKADGMKAPKVVAKGADLVAQKIKRIAADAGIPLVENVPLARTLFKSVKVGQFIPRVLYQAVAEVLAYVYRLKKQAGGR